MSTGPENTSASASAGTTPEGASVPSSPELTVPDQAASVPDVQSSEEPTEPEVMDNPFLDGPAEPLEFLDDAAAAGGGLSEWYILKVQVNREDSIKDALLRRVKMHGLDAYFQEVIVPTEDVAEFTKTGKRRVVKRKIYPGYILVKMIFNDDTWFLVRETPGIGDFTGKAGKPAPMDPVDVEKILRTAKVVDDGASQVRTAIPFKIGDRVRVKEGYFQNFEGDIDKIDEASGGVTVMINIFGRSTPVELLHWQIEAV